MRLLFLFTLLAFSLQTIASEPDPGSKTGILRVRLTSAFGTPPTGEQVRFATSEHSPKQWLDATRGESDTWLIHAPMGLDVAIRASADGHAPFYQMQRVTSNNLTAVPILIELSLGISIPGTVEDRDGNAVTSGVVMVEYVKTRDSARRGRKGNLITEFRDVAATAPVKRNGRFELSQVPSGSILMRFQAPGYFEQFEIGEDNPIGVSATSAPETLKLMAIRTGFVEGRVAWTDGAPAQGIGITAAYKDDWHPHFSHTSTGPDGSYRLEEVPDVPYAVYISDDSVAGSPSRTPDGVNVTGVDFTLEKKQVHPREYSASTYVVEAETGRPITDFQVEIVDQTPLGSNLQIKRENTFPDVFSVYSDKHFGSLLVKVSAPGRAPVWRRLAAREPKSVVKLYRAGQLTGTLRYNDTNSPVGGTTVTLKWDYDWGYGYVATTTAEGRFVFPAAPASSQLTVDVQGSETHAPQSIEAPLKPGEKLDLQDCAVTRAGRIRLAVVQGPESTPVQDEPVFLQGGYSKTNNSGRCDFPVWKKEASWTLPERNLYVESSVAMAPGEARQTTVSLSSSVVTVQPKQPGIWYYQAESESGGLRYELKADNHRQNDMLVSDDAGIVQLVDLPPGEWLLHGYANPEGERSFFCTFTVSISGNLRIEPE